MWEAFFAHGARTIRTCSIDGRSRKLLAPKFGWVMHRERGRVDARLCGLTERMLKSKMSPMIYQRVAGNQARGCPAREGSSAMSIQLVQTRRSL